jgi:hypothetical protein
MQDVQEVRVRLDEADACIERGEVQWKISGGVW